MAKGVYERKSLTERHKRRISKKMRGRKLSKEHKRNIGKASIRLGLKPPTKYGEKNHFWRGGVSFEVYGVDWTEDLRESIRKRDSYVCQICGIHQDELGGYQRKLDVHHIDYDKRNLNPINLIILCRHCHNKTNFNRKYWIKYFNN